MASYLSASLSSGDAFVIGVIAFAGAMFGQAGAAYMLRRAERGFAPIDVPDERRLHTRPTPRGGGLGMFLGGLLVVPSSMMLAADDVDQAMVAVVALAWALPNGLLGWVDDHRPQAIGRKFAVQIGAAALAVYLGLRLESVAVPPFGEVSLGVLSWPISILWLVWVANLFNLMDGMDALAAGSATVFFTGYGVLAFGSGAFGLSLLAVGCAGTCVGFLRYNWPPARIFMGDAGSLFCGAALGGLGLALARGDGGGVPIAVSAILLGPFAFDATYTIARRVIRRVPRPWSAHRTHIYQRLVTAGWTQRRVRGTYFGLAAVFAVIAVSLPGWPRTWQAAGLGAALGGCAALVLAMWAAEAEASEDADEWTSGSSVTGPDSTDGSTDSSADD